MKRSREPRPGNSFCYLEAVEGSGVELLSIILERLGFEKFISNDSTIIDIKTNRIRDGYSKRKRFAVITGKITSITANLRNILRVYNNPSNIDGEYIQILLASETARDGINLANVVRGYVMSAGWHESGMHQALSRFIRATSHKELINRNLLEMNATDEEKEKYRLPVDVFRMAAIKPGERDIFLKNLDLASVDIRNYIRAEEKDIKIKRILRHMKECAFDGYLNYKRNVRSTDKNFSRESDYSEKYMKLWTARGYLQSSGPQ